MVFVEDFLYLRIESSLGKFSNFLQGLFALKMTI